MQPFTQLSVTATFKRSACAAAASVLIAAACGEKAAPTPRRVAIEVSAGKSWQDTGVTLAAGQAFELTNVTGIIRDLDTEIRGGGGSDYICGSSGCCEPMPNERRSALVARIDGETFFVGDGVKRTAQSGGRLFLRVNDCDEGLHDNSGTLTVLFLVG